MKHAAVNKRKSHNNLDDSDVHSEKHKHAIASADYRNAKRREYFCTGDDVLRLLDSEMDAENTRGLTSYRRRPQQALVT